MEQALSKLPAVKSSKLFICFILALTFLIFSRLEAGVFRDRDRFNVEATGHGFWMKGKCVLPAGRLGIADDSAVFKDIGCIVKNRKGKRRPRKEKANIRMNIDYYGYASETLRKITESNKQCFNSKSCREKNFRINLEEMPHGFIGDITGLYACIEGWKSETSSVAPKQVIVSLGNVYRFANEEERRIYYSRLCPSGRWFGDS